MFQTDGWWFPDGESHLPEWMLNPKVRMILNGRASYQGAKQCAAMDLCKQFRTAVDVGAHIGLWSWNMVHKFKRVEAFEPVAAHRDCFEKNVWPEEERIWLHECALGDHEGMVSIRTEPTSSGDSRVDGPGDIPMKTLDSFGLHDVDFIKIDTEGHELFVLRGAEETIDRCRPVICVEQKPGHGKHFGIGDTDAIPYLQSLGYKTVKILNGDYLMVPA